MGKSNTSQSNPAHSIYLFALIGGLIRWLLVEKRKGKKLYQVVTESEKYRNSLVFLVFIIFVASKLTLFA